MNTNDLLNIRELINLTLDFNQIKIRFIGNLSRSFCSHFETFKVVSDMEIAFVQLLLHIDSSYCLKALLALTPKHEQFWRGADLVFYISHRRGLACLWLV
jgi:hypothetical protein